MGIWVYSSADAAPLGGKHRGALTSYTNNSAGLWAGLQALERVSGSKVVVVLDQEYLILGVQGKMWAWGHSEWGRLCTLYLLAKVK